MMALKMSSQPKTVVMASPAMPGTAMPAMPARIIRMAMAMDQAMDLLAKVSGCISMRRLLDGVSRWEEGYRDRGTRRDWQIRQMASRVVWSLAGLGANHA